MRIDYHMHLEYFKYTISDVKKFVNKAKEMQLDEIGFTEHTHGFYEFKDLYYDELILDTNYSDRVDDFFSKNDFSTQDQKDNLKFIGEEQSKWLGLNKFKHSLEEYIKLIENSQELNMTVKRGLEVCNFSDYDTVKRLIEPYKFDYLIGSIHFLKGWAYDNIETKKIWRKIDVNKLYEEYVNEIIRLCEADIFDIIGHPFNIRLFNIFPSTDIKELLYEAADAIKRSDMTIDVNTGNLYRYYNKEISPYREFMEIVAEKNIPVTISSDAHSPDNVGKYIDEAIKYVKEFGYNEIVTYERRKRKIVKL